MAECVIMSANITLIHMSDNSGFDQMFPVQRYRPNRSGTIALSIYCAASTVRKKNTKSCLSFR